ncbi:DUF484 family protein [Azospirillum halopraeferens]|uniref:DUF484 family protein n=1 Tax=Azospirillum halopraeferens TaxID=34010 RepID=UPI00042635DA|nr:DUF484 family protein [Azospirillum halopraeferens]
MAPEPGSNRTTPDTLTPEAVCAYLRANPDFLVRNAELVHHLTPPSADRGRGVVDLQAFMVERLRGEVRHLKDQQRELVVTTRANLNSQNRIHAAVLFLLDARSLEHLIQTITTDLAILLDLDVAGLVIESNGHDHPHVHRSGVRVVEPGAVNQWLGTRDVVLLSDVRGAEEIFGPGAGLVRSQALIRLKVSSETPDGILAFGSRDPAMFHDGQATELVNFLARVVERVIRSWLDLPA